jgi:nicotinamidase-related amidase
MISGSSCLFFNKDEFMNNIDLLIECARKCKIPVLFSFIEMFAPKFESSARLYTYNRIFARMQQRPLLEKRDLSLAVNRDEDEMLITKHTMSIFIGTDFERMIRNTAITTIVFTGISIEGGIESSARDALNRDFYAVLVSDAVSSLDKDAHTRSTKP